MSGSEAHDVVVIRAGQSGLAMSWHLHDRDIDHVVLERGAVDSAGEPSDGTR
jgi:putative flavoprotein involved in K+ transport